MISGFTKHLLRPVLAAALLFTGSAHAHAPRVIKAELHESGPGTYRIDVTIRHADTGWDHYADKWEVLAPDGRVLGTRVLYHPHVNEQPFTRSLSGLKLPPDIRFVQVRPHDKVHGAGALSAQIPVPGRWVPPKCRPDEAPDLMPKN